ncbi:nuclear pore glycoprotein p62-like isoform X1 [Spea bombifrons]|uniref:nuclear pore glycoprotein p62-like isoform X1 n=1 Tax=Spea bombifrons TaxID=233779 RepID=UPI00234BE04E|nr:nuclear pore glycoprotein p62-like isoform X1 [Spea bombifrons]
MSGFNFGSTAPTGGFSFGTPKTAASTATPGFSFGGGGTAPSGGFSFGGTTQNPVSSSGQQTGLFSFSTTASPAGSTAGFSFGTQPTSTTAAGGQTFGNNAPKISIGSGVQPAAGSNISSITQQSVLPSGGFSFGLNSGNTAPPASGSGSFSLSGGVINTTASSAFGQQQAPAGLTFGTSVSTAVIPTSTNSQTATTFNLGVPTAASSSGFGLPSTVLSSITSAPTSSTSSQAVGSTPSSGLSFGIKPSDTASAVANVNSTSTTHSLSSLIGSSGTSLFSPVVSSTASTPVTTTTTTGLTLGSSAASLNFGLKIPASSAAQGNALTTSTSLGVKPLVGMVGQAATASASVSQPVMTYAQLENLINKWSLELEDQEKHFLQQATQVNAWDRTLILNGEKITALHREMEKVKLDQKRLDQELDFILSQQKELEDLLIPLEESVKEQSGTIYLQHADEEREKTYKLAENIDAQLKRMAQDLKDVIEHLNTSATPGDTSNPLQQICKILNAHMDSLQWIDQNTALLQRKVEQVTKECESRKKEQDRGFSITFD